jgi:hypothetical protein
MAEGDPHVQKLVEAVRKAEIRTECPACSHNVTGPFERVVVLQASGIPEGFRTLGLVCEQCGFVRLFAASVLGQYMDPRDED